jgi:hypothetical protein
MRYIGASTSFYQRTIIRGFQEGIGTGSAVTLGGLMAGGFLYTMRNEGDGKETKIEDILINGIKVSGVLGMPMEMANRASFAFGGMDGVDLGQGFGGSHYSGLTNNILALKGIGTMAVGGRPSTKEIGSIINAIPLNNAIYTRSLFNGLEDLLRDEYNYGDKYGSPFEGRTELEKEVLADEAKKKQRKLNDSKKTEEVKAEKAEKKLQKKQTKEELRQKGLLP